MQDKNESRQSVVDREKEPAGTLKFGKNTGFQIELRRRVDEFFANSDRKERDCPQMYVKTAIL